MKEIMPITEGGDADFGADKLKPEVVERISRLRSAIREAGGNQVVGSSASIPISTIGSYLAGREMKLNNAVAIADACGVTVEWLATGRPPRRRPAEGEAVELEKVNSFREGPHLQAPHRGENSKYSVLPSYNVNASGHLAYKSRQIVEHFTFDTAWLIGSLKVAPDKVFLADIWDNDMISQISLGDTVMIDTSWRETRTGEIYALAQGEHIILRRLVLADDDARILIDDPSAKEPIYVQPGEMFPLTLQDQKTLYLGRVVWHSGSV